MVMVMSSFAIQRDGKGTQYPAELNHHLVQNHLLVQCPLPPPHCGHGPDSDKALALRPHCWLLNTATQHDRLGSEEMSEETVDLSRHWLNPSQNCVQFIHIFSLFEETHQTVVLQDISSLQRFKFSKEQHQ